jgi:hypothetical protein
VDETRLDPRYILARVQCQWRFDKGAQPPVDVAVHSIFILEVNAGAPVIVFQHERDEFQDLLRTAGLLPAKSLGS